MFENILVGILFTIVIAAAVFGWIIDNRGISKKEEEENNTSKEE